MCMGNDSGPSITRCVRKQPRAVGPIEGSPARQGGVTGRGCPAGAPPGAIEACDIEALCRP